MSRDALVAATNELFRLGASPTRASVGAAIEALTLSCRAIRAFLEDAAAAAAFDEIAKTNNALFLQGEVPYLADFAKEFVRAEQDLLLNAGLSDGAVRSLMEAGHEVLSHCTPAPLHVAKLYSSLNRLEHRVCGRADQIRRSNAERREQVRVRDSIVRAGVGVGGAAVAAVNVGAVLGTPVISVPYAAMSSMFGGSLVSAALGSPWDKEPR